MKTKKFTLTAISLLTLLGAGGMKAPVQSTTTTAGLFAPVSHVKMASTSYPIYNSGSSILTLVSGSSIDSASGTIDEPYYTNSVGGEQIPVDDDFDRADYLVLQNLEDNWQANAGLTATDHDFVNLYFKYPTISNYDLYADYYSFTIRDANGNALKCNWGSSDTLGEAGTFVVSFPTSYLVKGELYLYWQDTESGESQWAGDLFNVYAVLVDSKAVVKDGETAEIAVNVDDAPTIESILSQVTAQDLLGADVTVSCTDTEKAKYNANQLGTYTLTLTATDTYGQTATCYLAIKVVDVTAPTVVLASGKNLNFYVNDTLSYSSLNSYFTITDNATSKGGTINAAVYKLDGTTLTSDYTFTAVGTHTLNVSVTDSSGNNTNKNFTITVTDNVPPVISRRDSGTGTITVGLSRVMNLSEADFLALFQAIDAVDGDVSANLEVSGDFIPAKVGNYDITIIATDKSGNQASYVASVYVDADMPPVFVLSDELVNATTSNPLTSAQIQQVIALAFYADENVTAADIMINDTDYQENSTTPGSYTVSYTVTYTDDGGEQHTDSKKLTIAVTGETADAEDDDLGWWARFWQCFKNWFRGVFTKFKFNCWITDAEWDARFAE